MTPAEFLSWLDGFLDEKDGLTADQVAKVRAQAQKLNPLKGLTLGPTPRAIGVGQAGGYVEGSTSARDAVIGALAQN